MRGQPTDGGPIKRFDDNAPPEPEFASELIVVAETIDRAPERHGVIDRVHDERGGREVVGCAGSCREDYRQPARRRFEGDDRERLVPTRNDDDVSGRQHHRCRCPTESVHPRQRFVRTDHSPERRGSPVTCDEQVLVVRPQAKGREQRVETLSPRAILANEGEDEGVVRNIEESARGRPAAVVDHRELIEVNTVGHDAAAIARHTELGGDRSAARHDVLGPSDGTVLQSSHQPRVNTVMPPGFRGTAPCSTPSVVREMGVDDEWFPGYRARPDDARGVVAARPHRTARGDREPHVVEGLRAGQPGDAVPAQRLIVTGTGTPEVWVDSVGVDGYAVAGLEESPDQLESHSALAVTTNDVLADHR